VCDDREGCECVYMFQQLVARSGLNTDDDCSDDDSFSRSGKSANLISIWFAVLLSGLQVM
jgi:hypothetical protein